MYLRITITALHDYLTYVGEHVRIELIQVHEDYQGMYVTSGQ